MDIILYDYENQEPFKVAIELQELPNTGDMVVLNGANFVVSGKAFNFDEKAILINLISSSSNNV